MSSRIWIKYDLTPSTHPIKIIVYALEICPEGKKKNAKYLERTF